MLMHHKDTRNYTEMAKRLQGAYDNDETDGLMKFMI